jgi:hypothetical protein
MFHFSIKLLEGANAAPVLCHRAAEQSCTPTGLQLIKLRCDNLFERSITAQNGNDTETLHH